MPRPCALSPKHSNRPISRVSAEPSNRLGSGSSFHPEHRMHHDRHDEHTPLWEEIAWCLFALASLSGLAFFVFVLLFCYQTVTLQRKAKSLCQSMSRTLHSDDSVQT